MGSAPLWPRVPPHIAKRAQRICDAGQKASDLTRQLLAFSRKQVLKPEKSDLNELMAATGRLLRRTFLGQSRKHDPGASLTAPVTARTLPGRQASGPGGAR